MTELHTLEGILLAFILISSCPLWKKYPKYEKPIEWKTLNGPIEFTPEELTISRNRFNSLYKPAAEIEAERHIQK